MGRQVGVRTTTKDRRSATEIALHDFRATPNTAVVDEKFRALVLKRMELAQSDALDALRDLALMPITANSANNMVKFMAASKLVGNQEAPASGAPADLSTVLKELNDAFAKNAPRIKSVRERTITFEEATPINGATVEGEAVLLPASAGQSPA